MKPAFLTKKRPGETVKAETKKHERTESRKERFAEGEMPKKGVKSKKRC